MTTFFSIYQPITTLGKQITIHTDLDRRSKQGKPNLIDHSKEIQAIKTQLIQAHPVTSNMSGVTVLTSGWSPVRC